MNPLRVIAPAAAALMLFSCSNEYIEAPGESYNNSYTKNWIRKYGLIDPEQNFNMAQGVNTTVDPSAFGEGVTISIYNRKPSKGGLLIGRTSRKSSFVIDVAKGSTSVYVVAAKADGTAVSAGAYDIVDGSVDISAPKAGKAPQLAPIQVPEGGQVFQFVVACEDLGDTGDVDFNDIVFGVNHIAGDDNRVEITPLAAGGILKAYIRFNNVPICPDNEIHHLINPGAPTDQMVNTRGFDHPGEVVPIYITDSNFSLADEMGSFSIGVEGRGDAISAPPIGTAPQMICVEGDWLWPGENVDIKVAYPDFEYWSQGDSRGDKWYKNPDTSVVEWRTASADPGEEEDPEPDTPQEVDPVADKSKSMIDKLGAAWSSGWKSGSGSKKYWDYVPGLVTKAILAYTEQYPDNPESATYLGYAKDYAKAGVTFVSGKPQGFEKGSLDNIATGKVLLSIYNADRAANVDYLTAATYMYNYLMKEYPRITASVNLAGVYNGFGGFWHKVSDYPNQMWLDGLYMGAAFAAEYLHTKNSSDVLAWNDIAAQFIIIHNNTWDSTAKLNYHGWSADPNNAHLPGDNGKQWWNWTPTGTSESYTYYANTRVDYAFWSRNNTLTGCSPEFWGRGIGWYFAALVDVLEFMPETNANYSTLLNNFRQVAEGIVARQDDTSNVWCQLVGHPVGYTEDGSNANYLEASASCMFTYALLKGLNLGLLSEETFGAAADAAYEGLNATFISESGNTSSQTYNGTYGERVQSGYINNICRSAGLGGLDNAKNSSNKNYYIDEDGNESTSSPSGYKQAKCTKTLRNGSATYYLAGTSSTESSYDTYKASNEGKGIGPYIFASLQYEKRLGKKGITPGE